MPPKSKRRPLKRTPLRLPSSSSSSSPSSSSSSSDEREEVAAVPTSKNSTKDSASRASENRDWDLSSLDQDQSRSGSPRHPAPSPPHPTSPFDPSDSNAAQASVRSGEKHLAAPGPVSSDEKHSAAQAPVSSDEKHSAAQAPVSSDEKHFFNTADANSPSNSKPLIPGEDHSEDECYVVDEDGNRVEKNTQRISPVIPSATPPKKRATAEDETGPFISPIKTAPLPSSAPKTPTTRGNASASEHASASDKASAAELPNVDAQSGRGGQASAGVNAKTSSNASASDDAKPKPGSPAFKPKKSKSSPSPDRAPEPTLGDVIRDAMRKGGPKPTAEAKGEATNKPGQSNCSPAVASGAAAKPQPSPTDLVLTPEALQIFLQLHNGERELLMPLESIVGGEEMLQQMVRQLQDAAEKKLGGLLPRERALSVLEVARHQHGADGWPDIDQAVLCLRKRGQATTPKTPAQPQAPEAHQAKASYAPAAVNPPPLSQSKEKPASPAQDEKAGEKRAREQEQKIAALENMLRSTQERADAQKQLLSIRSEQLQEMREREGIMVEQRDLQDNLIFNLQHAEAPKPSKFAKLEDASYTTRLEYLVGRGHTFEDAMEALEATKLQGQYSSGRAEAHLNAILDQERKRTLQKANEAAAAAADLPEISEHSALGHLLDKNEDAVDIVIKMREVHAKSRAKGMHNAKNVLSAAHLVEAPGIKGDASLTRKGHAFLSQVALAVSEDCTKCKDLRDKLEQEARWAKEKEKAQADKAKADAEKRTKEKEEKRKLDHKPHVLNFRVEDSKRDVTLPRGFCGKCEKGYDGGKWLYPCGRCKKGYHLLCTIFTLIRTRDTEYFACSPCLDELEQNQRKGIPQPNFEVLGHDIGRGKAPKHSEAVGGKSDPPSVPQDQGGGGAVRSNPFQTPPPTNLVAAPPSGADAGHTVVANTNRKDNGGLDDSRIENDFLVPKASTVVSKTNVQIKDYFMWEDVPKDWVAKTDPKNPSKEETLPDHPEKGYSKTAYQNWRRRNVTARDVAQAGGGSLGPLSRSLSLEMRVCLGTQFHRDPAVAWLRPFPIANDKSFDSWLDKDPGFEWMKKLPDELLLELCDKKFGVKKNDLFLSKRYYTLPATNSKGEVLYHVSTFNRWITEWQNELSELKVSGCSFEGVNLRQTLINALSPSSMLHNQATVYQTESIHALIAYLRDWLMHEEESAISLRNKQQSAIQNAQAAAGAVPVQANLQLSSATASHTQHSNVLITQIVEQQQKILETLAASGGAAGGDRGKALPAHLKATEGNLCKCRGCNNIWNKGRKIPCFQGCKYADHPHYNKNCKTQDATTQQKLTWAGFKEKFPGTTPPKGYLEWEAYVNGREAKKRGSDSTK